jgi:hypothetical protein
LDNTFRLAKKDERVSVVAMVTMPNLHEFYEMLRKKYTVDIPEQPAHITLYTLQPDAGIDLNSDTDIANLTSLVTIPELGQIQAV